ncbi:hypothetical protein A3842_11035 [Paenibacillus sp. P3E]|uniref:replicative helicase loader/inhibitor n=1 Tax=Paenibacillus sp. P3E TaxID=1349435 RepID=UPI00093F78E0|nr:replicative helicase loader/inhibitor [Paenibacillus sp. P3E]OKP81607.1 hypothetical protein A3842_11035 [Paenibacillus sp. P3E]
MEKGQAVSIVKRLAAYYPNWKVDKSIVEIWVDTLVGEDYENALQNMKEYISSNEYPPPIAAIIKPNSRIEGKREIERTRQMLQEQEELRKSIPSELPWVRDGMTREAWAQKKIAEKRGSEWNTSA